MHWRQLPNGRVTHSLEWAIVALALLVIPVILIEESHPSPAVRDLAAVGNWVIWLGFAAELTFVLKVAPRKRAALRAHWLDVAIVILTAPFLPALLSFLRLTRLMRLLRLLRLAALASRALSAQRMLTSRQGFRYVALATDAARDPRRLLGLARRPRAVHDAVAGDVVGGDHGHDRRLRRRLPAHRRRPGHRRRC